LWRSALGFFLLMLSIVGGICHGLNLIPGHVDSTPYVFAQ
jgi:hypothetical protein